MNDYNKSRFLRLCRRLDELTTARNGKSKAPLIIGITFLIAVGLGVTTPVLLVWFICAASIVGSTIYWFKTDRHGQNKKTALFVLSVRWIFFALITIIVGGLFWIVYSMFKNYTPH
jgi:hypothetical protein